MRFFSGLLVSLLASQCLAQDIAIVGQITQPLPQTARFRTSGQATSVGLLQLSLSPKAKTVLNKRAQNNLSSTNVSNYAGVTEKQLGMNDVPVLNQGSHGTCVTFANTAALDAALKKGDYISQLCQLQLGLYLETNGYGLSGWDGAWGKEILTQMKLFGIVSKFTQETSTCNGLTEYPINNTYTGEQLALVDYHLLSEPLPEQIDWTAILDRFQAILDDTDTNVVLTQVKQAVQSGDRLTFGVGLIDYNRGVVGAIGTYKNKNDAWVLTPEMIKNIQDGGDLAGHEMIITGFNDKAVAIDDQGRKHVGLLTLRNSWGNQIGDQGNFYMSYAYFKALVLEVQRIRNL